MILEDLILQIRIVSTVNQNNVIIQKTTIPTIHTIYIYKLALPNKIIQIAIKTFPVNVNNDWKHRILLLL